MATAESILASCQHSINHLDAVITCSNPPQDQLDASSQNSDDLIIQRPISPDDTVLQGLQNLYLNLQTVISSSDFPSFLTHMLNVFTKTLQLGKPVFTEIQAQQLRKLILEIIRHLCSDHLINHLKVHADGILNLMTELLKVDNEENCILCLDIVVQLHKCFHPASSPEKFLNFSKEYFAQFKDVINNVTNVPLEIMTVNRDFDAFDDSISNEITKMTFIQFKESDIKYAYLPRGTTSPKVFAKLSTTVAPMYQLYKDNAAIRVEIEQIGELFLNVISMENPDYRNSLKVLSKWCSCDEIFSCIIISLMNVFHFLTQSSCNCEQNVKESVPKLAKVALEVLCSCPQEILCCHDELHVSINFTLTTKLGESFMDSFRKILKENVSANESLSVNETVIPKRYPLSLENCQRLVVIFSKVMHNETLRPSIQIKACSMILTLIQCIKPDTLEETKNLLIQILEMFLYKLRIVSKFQFDTLSDKCASPVIAIVKQEPKEDILAPSPPPPPPVGSNGKVDKPTFGFPEHVINYSLMDCRQIVKTLIFGAKSILLAIINIKKSSGDRFTPREIHMLIRLIRYTFKVIDIYTIVVPVPGQPSPSPNTIPIHRSKEGAEILEIFATLFLELPPSTFQEVLSSTTDYLVENTMQNYCLQMVAQTFLSNSDTSPIFGRILLDCLVKRMEELGSSKEKATRHIELYKLIFKSVLAYAETNEKMLQSYLHRIVRQSLDLSLTAEYPCGYFVLLSSLFNSVGSGDLDLIFKEFVTLLPKVLKDLNHFLSGVHKQSMKELFAELSLTVPVTMSSRLPYLSMFMQPLVTALNGSETLVLHGLNILEFYVNSFQPNYVYDYFEPVWSELLQSLWRALRCGNKKISRAAFKVLGKYGGYNREKMIEPQKLNWKNGELSPSLTVDFWIDERHKYQQIELPVGKIIETAVTALNSADTDSFYQKHSWEVIKGFLSTMIDHAAVDPKEINNFFSSNELSDENIIPLQLPLCKCINSEAREVVVKALTGMIVAASINNLQEDVISFMTGLVYQFTSIIVVQQSGVVVGSGHPKQYEGMDPLVLIDAVCAIMGQGDSNLYEPAKFVLMLILDTCMVYMSSERKPAQLPFLTYLVEKICSLCYEEASYAKHGGCIAIQFFMEHVPKTSAIQHLSTCVKALFYITVSMEGDISSGITKIAKLDLETLLKKFAADLTGSLLYDVAVYLFSLIISPYTSVREEAMHLLKEVLPNSRDQPLEEMARPFQQIVADTIPSTSFVNQFFQNSVDLQVAVLEATIFCIENFTDFFDLKQENHVNMYEAVKSVCHLKDDTLREKYPCYKHVTDFFRLRKAMCRLLVLCFSIDDDKEEVFELLYEGLYLPNQEVQEMTVQSLKYLAHYYAEDVHSVLSQHLPNLELVPMMKTEHIVHQSYIVQLRKFSLLDELCAALLEKFLDKLMLKVERASDDNVALCRAISTIFQNMDTVLPSFFIPALLRIVLNPDRELMTDVGRPFRESIVKFFGMKPWNTLRNLLDTPSLDYEQANKFFEYILLDEAGDVFQDCIFNASNDLANLIVESQDPNKPHQIRNCCILVKLVLWFTKKDESWLPQQGNLVTCLKELWQKTEFPDHHVNNIDFAHRKLTRLLCKCLLNYFKQCRTEIRHLFNLLRVLSDEHSSISDFSFLRIYLKDTVTCDDDIKWKTSAFLEFVDIFTSSTFSQSDSHLMTKILRYIIIPSFSDAFRKKMGVDLINGLDTPNSKDNVISVFINSIILHATDNVNSEVTATAKGISDDVRISLLQLSCLLVEQAHEKIRAISAEACELRSLITFAWPCLLPKNSVDPVTKYHGHLLLACIIVKFSIHPKVILQVFLSLLRAHVPEARAVVRQALDFLIPVMQTRLGSNITLLSYWTHKIISEGEQNFSQLVHMLQLLVKHWEVYRKECKSLILLMGPAVERLSSPEKVVLEHKKLAIEVAEVIIKWQLPSIDSSPKKNVKQEDVAQCGDSVADEVKPGPAHAEPDNHLNSIVNCLLHMACQVTNSTCGGLSGDLSELCINLVKKVFDSSLLQDLSLDLSWIKDILKPPNDSQHNFVAISASLELLNWIIEHKTESILHVIQDMQNEIAGCMKYYNNKIIRDVHNLISHCMEIFPVSPDKTSTNCFSEDLGTLDEAINNFIASEVNNYVDEKSEISKPGVLYGTITILKAICSKNPCYIDKFLDSFLSILQKMQNYHLNPPEDDVTISYVDILMMSLELVNQRLPYVSRETQNLFINSLLADLVEKSQDVKLIENIIQLAQQWVQHKKPENQSVIEEMDGLILKMISVGSRFPENPNLHIQFLNLVYDMYSDSMFSNPYVESPLNSAFNAGLRCVEPTLREKYFSKLNSQLSLGVYDRFHYIAKCKSWQDMGNHFWIKQCIELMLASSSKLKEISQLDRSILLPCKYPAIGTFMNVSIKTEIKEEITDEAMEVTMKEEEEETGEARSKPWAELLSSHTLDRCRMDYEKTSRITKQTAFLLSLKTLQSDFCRGITQMCHLDATLAQSVWLTLCPKLWGILPQRQKNSLAWILPEFLTDLQQIQKHCVPNPAATFADSVLRFVPFVQMDASLIRDVGRNFNLWQSACLLLETLNFEETFVHTLADTGLYEHLQTSEVKKEACSMLCQLYANLEEEDLLGALWKTELQFTETAQAISFEQQGCFLEAQAKYLEVMEKCKREKYFLTSRELQWENTMALQHWERCTKELCQWKTLETHSNNSPSFKLENAWRKRDWNKMQSILKMSLDQSTTPMWKVNLYRGYVSICHPVDSNLSLVDELVKDCSNYCIQEWKKLPHIVSHAHIPLLQASQQIIELMDSAELQQFLQHEELHLMRVILKKWPNRLPLISDSLSFWSDITAWRQEHYGRVVSSYKPEYKIEMDIPSYDQLGRYPFADCNILFAKIARKQGLTQLSYNALNKLKMSSDSKSFSKSHYAKVIQQLKCSHSLALDAQKCGRKNEFADILDNSLKTVDNMIHYKDVTQNTEEIVAEIVSMMGQFLGLRGKGHEACNTFETAVTMSKLSPKPWNLWGDFLMNYFIKRKDKSLKPAILALTAIMKSCQDIHASKSRKQLSKIFWLLCYDVEHQMARTINQYATLIPSVQWAPWIPQLMTCLQREEGGHMMNLMEYVGLQFPQAMFFQVHMLMSTLQQQQQQIYLVTRCEEIIGTLRTDNPKAVSALEYIYNEMSHLRENAYDEIFRSFKSIIRSAYAECHNSKVMLAKEKVSKELQTLVKNAITSFSNQEASMTTQCQSTFKKMKEQLTNDFNANCELSSFVDKLQKWIVKFQARINLLPKSLLLDEKCCYMSHFSQQLAEVEIPGMFLQQKTDHYHVYISKFMPNVDIIQKHNAIARRLHIKGSDGKIYSYLIVHDASPNVYRRDERVLQLIHMLNTFFGKQKETSRRFLHFTPQRMLPLGPHVRLVEDNVSSLSLFDIYHKWSLKNFQIEERLADRPVFYYYERLAALMILDNSTALDQQRVIFANIQKNILPSDVLKDWAKAVYPNAVDYFTFRKQFTLQLAVISFFNYILNLTTLEPNMMYIHKDSGLINASYMRFNIDDKTGQLNNELQPFRLTPNIAEFVTKLGKNGLMLAAMTAASRCLILPNFNVCSFYYAILRDEMIDWHKQQAGANASELHSDNLINRVVEAVNVLMVRLQTLSRFEDAESAWQTLLDVAEDPLSLCSMDPAWYPWL